MRHTGSRIPKEIRMHFCKLREAASCHEHPLCFGARIPRRSNPAIAARPTHAIGQHCIASAHACDRAPGMYVKSRQAPERSCFSSFFRALATSWAASGQARLAMSGAMTSTSMPMKTVNETPRMVRKHNTPQRWVNSTCKRWEQSLHCCIGEQFLNSKVRPPIQGNPVFVTVFDTLRQKSIWIHDLWMSPRLRR